MPGYSYKFCPEMTIESK